MRASQAGGVSGSTEAIETFGLNSNLHPDRQGRQEVKVMALRSRLSNQVERVELIAPEVRDAETIARYHEDGRRAVALFIGHCIHFLQLLEGKDPDQRRLQKLYQDPAQLGLMSLWLHTVPHGDR